MKQNKFIKKSSAILASVMMSLSGCMTGVSAQTVNTPVTSSVTLQQTTQKAVKPKTTTKKEQAQSTLVKSQSKTSADPGCYISDFGIKKMTDGTPGFDSDNNPGNDSGKSNKIVRSFDYVNYDLEYVTAITDKAKVVNEAYVGIEFSLDKDPSKAVFNKDSIAWCENPVTTYYYEDGTNSTKWDQKRTVVKQVLTGRRKITNNADMNAIPGIGTLSFGVYVKGDVNGAVIQPEFKCWIEGTDKVKSATSEAVTVSAEPRYNIRLLRNTTGGNPDPIVYIAPDKSSFSLKAKDGYMKGRMESYSIQLELLNTETDKGLKGIELPSGDITFDLKATEKIDDTDVTSQKDYSPFLWDYKLNDYSTTGEMGRNMNLNGDSYVYNNPASHPYGYSDYFKRDFRATWDSGKFSMVDNGNGHVSVTLKDYSFDLDRYYFPTGTIWTNREEQITFQKNHGIFSMGYAQFFCQFPREVDATTNLKMFMKASNFKASSIGGQVTNSEVLTNDNTATNVVTLYPRGNYDSRQIWSNCTSYGAPDGTASVGEIVGNGRRQYLYGVIIYYGDNPLTGWNFLQKFDDKVFTPTGQTPIINHYANAKNEKGDTTILYAAKPDKTGWKGDDEQNKAKEEDLVYFKTYKELVDAGYTCVAFLIEVRNGSYSDAIIYFDMKVNDSVKPGTVAMVKHSSKAWDDSAKVGSWTEHLIKGTTNMYGLDADDTSDTQIVRKPKYNQAIPYEKVVYTDGAISSGNTNGYEAGNSLLILGDRTGISIVPENEKYYYDMDNGERTVTYKMSPTLSLSSANRENTEATLTDNVYITTVIPKDLHYKEGSASIEPVSVKENSDGTTTIKWTLKNQKIGEPITPVTFDCKIGVAGTKTDVVNNQQIPITAKISSDQDKKRYDSAYGNLSKATINIIKLATSSIAKTVDKELNDVGGLFKFSLNMGNTSEIEVQQARLYDVMPFNGDGRGTKYHGKYRITSVTLDYKDAPKTFDANKSNAYIQTTTDKKYQANPDYNNILNYTGLDSWNKLTGGVVNTENKTITFAVNANDITALFVDFGGNIAGNEFVKAHIQCTPLDMNGKLMQAEDGSVQVEKDVYVNSFYEYATNQIAIVQSNIVKTTVVDRMLSGRVWNDRNKDGLQSEDEPALPNKKIMLYRTTASKIGVKKDSVDVAGKKLFPAYTTTGDAVDSVTTDEDGDYSFHHLEAGTYTAVLDGKILQYTVTNKKQGNDTDIDSDATAGSMNEDKPLNALTDDIGLVDAWKSLHNDFGLYTTSAAPVEVKKEWVDESNKEGFRPGTIKVKVNGSDGSEKIYKVTLDTDWKQVVDDLQKYTEDGKPIKYTFTEINEDNKYTGEATYEAGKVTFQNKRVVEKTSISVQKVWDDGDNRDGLRPKKVAIELFADGELVEEYDGLNPSVNWSHTFTDLDKYKNGTEIQYTVREKSVDGYTATYKNDGNKWTITNKYTPEKISLIINKKWDDAENQDGIRPASVKAVLYANGKKTQDIELNENNHWSVSVPNLYKNENGKPIQYEIKEITETKGYTSSVSNKGNTWTITNTHKPSKISVSGTKTWKDDNDRDGVRLDSVTVRLFAEGKEIARKKVNAQSDWKYEFTDLDEFKAGQKIAYSITEDAVEGYSTTYNKFNLINTHDINKLSVSVRKVWNDGNNQDGIRPESVTVRLYQNDIATDKTLTLSEENGWQGSFVDLFKNENGATVNYSVKEDNVPEGYECDIKKDDNGVFVITNSHIPAVMSIPVSKVWDDDNNRDGIRSSDIDVALYKNGILYDSKTITADSNWNTAFENVPVNEGGQPINWTVDEMDVPSGYEVDVKKTGNGFVVTNSYEPEKISLKVSKEWKDEDDADGIRPESVTIHLMANGTEIGEYQITKENGWKLEIKDLFRYDNGSEIKYTIAEDEVEGYKSEIQDYRNASDSNESDDKDSEEHEPAPCAQFLPDKDAEYEFDFVVKNTHEVKPKAVKSQSPTPLAQVTVSSDEIKTGIHLDHSVWMILGCFCLGCLAGIGLHKIKQKRTRD